MANDSARFQAVKLLERTFHKGGYSNILLDKALENSGLEGKDRAFCSALYYGVLERKITLDYIISKYSKFKLKSIDGRALNVLRSGIYQLKFMDNVPDSAAVNESVKLVKKLGLSRLSGFVNAVMRNFIRDEKKIEYPKDRYEELSVKYSVPVWLVKMLLDSYSERKTLSVLETSLNKPPVTIRLNNLKGSEQELLERLSDMELTPTDFHGCFEAGKADVRKSAGFSEGLFHVQDIASQLCCMALDPKPGQVILDMCAAPGGKAFTMAELSEDRADIRAFDIHECRVKLISDGAERLGIRSVKAQEGDGLIFDDKLPQADRILCDVPCSGLGVIRRKPEIKYKNPEEFKDLPDIQYKILENASRYLKPGGELVYSTCTLNPKENDMVIDRFLRGHRNFEGVSFLEELGQPFGDYKAVLFPDNFGSDGFFISKIRRKE